MSAGRSSASRSTAPLTLATWACGVFAGVAGVWALPFRGRSASGTALRGAYVRSTAVAGLVAACAAVWSGVAASRLAGRRRRVRAEAHGDRVALEGAAVTGGRSATVVLRGDRLVLEQSEVRTWAVVVAGLGFAAHTITALGGMLGWLAPTATTLPVWVWLLAFGPLATRRVERAYPIDAFHALEVRDKAVRLHRRGGAVPPLEIALRSWSVPRLAAELRARHPNGLVGEPPHVAPAARDELAEARDALRSWMPPGHAAHTTAIGLALVAASLGLGAAYWLDPGSRLRFWSAVALWGAAGFVWFESAARGGMQRAEAARLAGPDAGPVQVHVRRALPDPRALLLPWVAAEIDAREERLVVTHLPRDPFEGAVVVGVAIAGGLLVFGSLTPWAAALYVLPLLLSGYPRRREDEHVFLPEHVLALDDAGGRGTLRLRDEDGERELRLRYGSAQGRRLVALVRAACPRARVTEPGWRKGPPGGRSPG